MAWQCAGGCDIGEIAKSPTYILQKVDQHTGQYPEHRKTSQPTPTGTHFLQQGHTHPNKATSLNSAFPMKLWLPIIFKLAKVCSSIISKLQTLAFLYSWKSFQNFLVQRFVSSQKHKHFPVTSHNISHSKSKWS